MPAAGISSSLSPSVRLLPILSIFSFRKCPEPLESARESGTFSVSARLRTPGPSDRAREERTSPSQNGRHPPCGGLNPCPESSQASDPFSWCGSEATAPRGERRGIFASSQGMSSSAGRRGREEKRDPDVPQNAGPLVRHGCGEPCLCRRCLLQQSGVV